MTETLVANGDFEGDGRKIAAGIQQAEDWANGARSRYYGMRHLGIAAVGFAVLGRSMVIPTNKTVPVLLTPWIERNGEMGAQPHN